MRGERAPSQLTHSTHTSSGLCGAPPLAPPTFHLDGLHAGGQLLESGLHPCWEGLDQVHDLLHQAGGWGGTGGVYGTWWDGGLIMMYKGPVYRGHSNDQYGMYLLWYMVGWRSYNDVQ